jgi:hypothetical protein
MDRTSCDVLRENLQWLLLLLEGDTTRTSTAVMDSRGPSCGGYIIINLSM